jgi:hypothetical protein
LGIRRENIMKLKLALITTVAALDHDRRRQHRHHVFGAPSVSVVAAADAGIARVGRQRTESKRARRQIIMAAKRPDLPAEWAVLGSNQ